MRKILISILVCLLLIGSAFFMVNGISKVNIKGIKGLSEKNGQIEQKISDLSNVISVTYANTESNLKRTANTLQDSKTEYENQAALSNSLSPSYASQLETYDIDYLWTKLGNYARDEKVVIKIDLVASGTSTNLYNLNFTTTGDYVNITNFIYEIENDSKLGFKIDEFKMNSSGDTLTATFSCKEVPIKVGSIDQATSNNQGGTTQSGSTTDTTGASAQGNTTSTTTGTNTTSNTTSNSTATASNTTATTGASVGTNTNSGATSTTTNTSTSSTSTNYIN
mgnify:FL=1